MFQISSEINIRAPQEVVWEVITDLKYYRDWNTQFSLIEGRVRRGERIRLKFSPLYYRGYTASPKIHEYKPHSAFGWKGLTMLPGVIDGEYMFRLMPIDDEITRLHFYQRYSGVLSFLLPQFEIFRDARKSCIKMNAEIKRRVEEVFSRQPVLSA